MWACGAWHGEIHDLAPLVWESRVAAAVEVRVPWRQMLELHVVDEPRGVAQSPLEALIHLLV